MLITCLFEENLHIFLTLKYKSSQVIWWNMIFNILGIFIILHIDLKKRKYKLILMKFKLMLLYFDLFDHKFIPLPFKINALYLEELKGFWMMTCKIYSYFRQLGTAFSWILFPQPMLKLKECLLVYLKVTISKSTGDCFQISYKSYKINQKEI